MALTKPWNGYQMHLPTTSDRRSSKEGGFSHASPPSLSPQSARLQRSVEKNSSRGCRQKARGAAVQKNWLCAAWRRGVWPRLRATRGPWCTLGRRPWSASFPISSLCRESEESRSLCFCPLAESSSIAPTCRKHSWLAGWSNCFVSSG